MGKHLVDLFRPPTPFFLRNSPESFSGKQAALGFMTSDPASLGRASAAEKRVVVLRVSGHRAEGDLQYPAAPRRFRLPPVQQNTILYSTFRQQWPFHGGLRRCVQPA